MPGRRLPPSGITQRVALSALVLFAATARAAPEKPADAAPPAPPSTSSAPTAPAPPPSTPSPSPSLPAGVVPGVPTTVPVPGDKPVYVIHAPVENRRVLIYLHGWCGKIQSVETWKETAAAHGTLIAPSGDLKCPNGRTKWSKKTDEQHERIQRAIAAVKEARGGALDPDDILLIGYSQGAARAYRLAQRHSGIYSRLVLGGPPEPPSTEYLGRARAIAVLGGELETTQYMRAGTADLQEAGKLARYFMLPKSKHGEYGPDAERVMTEVFAWLERVAPN